jgi:hypothetical protein
MTTPGDARSAAETDQGRAWEHLAGSVSLVFEREPGEPPHGYWAEVAAAIDRVARVCAPGGTEWDENASDTDLLAALHAIRQIRADSAGVERDILETARARGTTWDRLAAALGMKDRRAAERRYRRLAEPAYDHGHDTHTQEGRVAATRTERALQRARRKWVRENAGPIRLAAATVLGTPDLDEHAQAWARAQHHRVHGGPRGRLRATDPLLPEPPRWPAQLRQAVAGDDLEAVFAALHHARHALAEPHPQLAEQINQLYAASGGAQLAVELARHLRDDEEHDS